jgi:hypothetical protein
MNRRGFFGRVAGSAAVASLNVETPSAAPAVEPVPTQFDFESLLPYDCDAGSHSVAQVLDRMGWLPDTEPIPLLIVHPSAWLLALEIRDTFRGHLAVKALRFSDDRDQWFVAWRGRRVGSVGA